jgi:ATP synthase protein I
MGKVRDFVERTSYLTVGLQFAFAVLIGLGIGYWLDRKLKTFPWMTIIWLIMGLIAGLRNLYREMRKIAK